MQFVRRLILLKYKKTNFIVWLGNDEEWNRVYENENGMHYVLMKSKVYMPLSCGLVIRKIGTLV